MKKIKFADLFSGIGGFRIGLERCGFECAYSAEIDEHACEMYETNFGDNPYQDLTKLSDKDIENIPDFDILCGGFPCQSFSISGKKLGFMDETRGTLFFEVLRILSIKKPSYFILENVKFLIHHDKGKTFNVMIDSLNDLGYTVNYKILNAKDFGVPQNRERIVIVGNRKGLQFNFNNLEKNEVHSMKNFLDDVDDNDYYLDESEYTMLPKNILKRQKSDLIFSGFRNKPLRKKGAREGTEYLSRVHRMPDRIYSINGVNPTISSQESSGRYFISYDNNTVRKLTLNEVYRFMGFPDDFIKIGTDGKLYNRAGNSVCCNMIQSIGKELKNTMDKKFDDKNPSDVLEKAYKEAKTNGEKYIKSLDSQKEDDVKNIVNKEKSFKGVYTVLFSSLLYKYMYPEQDVRFHQHDMENGYSGRTFDTKYVTPFLKQKRFDGAMKESGWLTRSLEQNHPFDYEFPGKIRSKKCKTAFLNILNDIEVNAFNPYTYLISMMYLSIQNKKKEDVAIINPVNSESNLEISDIMELLREHFEYKNYKGGQRGNSILPVIAMYSIYQVLVKELARYHGKKLSPRMSHYSSDFNSGETGDIVVRNDSDDSIYEAVDVKYGIPIDNIMINDAYNKFKSLGTMQRYYLLSTEQPENKDQLDKLTSDIYKKSGTQIIANGLMKTISYYLRLISDTDKFLTNYTNNLKSDPELNYEHKLSWNRLVDKYMGNN